MSTKVRLSVVGIRNYCPNGQDGLPELFERIPVGSSLYLGINAQGMLYPGSVSVYDSMCEMVGSIAKTERRYIELAIPEAGMLKCTVVGHSLERHCMYVEAENNVGIKPPYIRTIIPEADEVIFATTKHDRRIKTVTQMLLTQLSANSPDLSQILKLATEYAEICCTSLDGETSFSRADILQQLRTVNKDSGQLDAVIDRIEGLTRDLGRSSNDVKTAVFREQYARVSEAAHRNNGANLSELEFYRKSLEFGNGGKLTTGIIDQEIQRLSHLLLNELMRNYVKANESDEAFANALYSLNYGMYSTYILYTRRIKLDYLSELRSSMVDVVSDAPADVVIEAPHELCVVLNSRQKQVLLMAEKNGIIVYNEGRKGYDAAKKTTKALVSYLCGKLFCGDYTTEDEVWIKGGIMEESLYCQELFGFDVSASRRKTRGKGAGKSPTGYQKVDNLFA